MTLSRSMGKALVIARRTGRGKTMIVRSVSEEVGLKVASFDDLVRANNWRLTSGNLNQSQGEMRR